jgi:anthranilate synthase component 2/putative glutamine amidotransferase
VSTPTRPKIGISTYRDPVSWGPWAHEAAALPTTYVDCVAQAGGLPLLLPPTDADLSALAVDAVAVLDGLVLSGGTDVDPARYDEPAHAETGEPQAGRDAWELALLAAALERDIPVLAICRGAQLLNVAQGGTLIQHLPEVPGAEDHRAGPGVYRKMPITLDPEALPGSVLGRTGEVSCYHHQAIGKLGDGLTVTGRAADGTIEAVTVDGRAFAVGVQWHPERDHELRLFTALVRNCGSNG